MGTKKEFHKFEKAVALLVEKRKKKIFTLITNPISNLTVQSCPEISRNDRSLNETIWTPKCDRLQVFDMVEEMKRKKSVNPLNANPTKLSNTLKQFGRNLCVCVCVCVCVCLRG